MYSGHDTVIAAVLGALGVFKYRCEWPHYASRLIFELWVHKDDSDVKIGLGEGVEHSNKTDKSATESKNLSGGRRRGFRLLYNGQELTHRVEGCGPVYSASASPNSKESADGKDASSGIESTMPAQLCDIQRLADTINKPLGSLSSFKEACNAGASR